MAQDEAASPQAVAARIGIDLPPGARVEHAGTISGQDDAARLVAVMPAAGWATLLAAVERKAGGPATFSPDHNFHLGPPGEGWRPGEMQGLETAQLPWNGGREALNIGHAPAGPGEVRLFLFWHQL